MNSMKINVVAAVVALLGVNVQAEVAEPRFVPLKDLQAITQGLNFTYNDQKREFLATGMIPLRCVQGLGGEMLASWSKPQEREGGKEIAISLTLAPNCQKNPKNKNEPMTSLSTIGGSPISIPENMSGKLVLEYSLGGDINAPENKKDEISLDAIRSEKQIKEDKLREIDAIIVTACRNGDTDAMDRALKERKLIEELINWAVLLDMTNQQKIYLAAERHRASIDKATSGAAAKTALLAYRVFAEENSLNVNEYDELYINRRLAMVAAKIQNLGELELPGEDEGEDRNAQKAYLAKLQDISAEITDLSQEFSTNARLDNQARKAGLYTPGENTLDVVQLSRDLAVVAANSGFYEQAGKITEHALVWVPKANRAQWTIDIVQTYHAGAQACLPNEEQNVNPAAVFQCVDKFRKKAQTLAKKQNRPLLREASRPNASEETRAQYGNFLSAVQGFMGIGPEYQVYGYGAHTPYMMGGFEGLKQQMLYAPYLNQQGYYSPGYSGAMAGGMAGGMGGFGPSPYMQQAPGGMGYQSQMMQTPNFGMAPNFNSSPGYHRAPGSF